MKQNEERAKKGYECIHAKDDGRLALVKFKTGVEIVCVKCNTCWELDLPFALGMAEDFKTTEVLNEK